MIKGSMFKKCISLVMVIAVLMSLAAPAAAATEETIGYVALGDAATAGYGLDEELQGVADYAVKVAEALGCEDNYVSYPYGKGYRVEEIRYLLDADYAGDEYTTAVMNENVSKLDTVKKAHRAEWQNNVAHAEVLSVQVGVNNFSTYIVEQMLNYAQYGEALYDMDWSQFAEDDVIDAMENVENAVMDVLLNAAPDKGDAALELIEFTVEVATYAVLSYVYNFNGMIEAIYELNPDLKDLYVIGIYNPFSGNSMSFTVEGKTIEVPIGDAMGALVELANAYSQILAPRAYNYTYVDPGTPELLIDQMADENLSVSERISDALLAWLMEKAGINVETYFNDKMGEYGIDEEIIEDILDYVIYDADTSEERMAYINAKIDEEVNAIVLEKLQEELKNYTGDFGTGDAVSSEEISDLLNDLEAAETEEAREAVVAEFVDGLLTDPEIVKQAATNEIYKYVVSYGLEDYITVENVDELLAAMENATNDGERRAIISEWMNDLAAAKITETVQAVVPEYTVEDAKEMLEAMEADGADAEAVAREYLLADGFHAYIVNKFEESYSDLELANYEDFDAFATAVEAADDYETVVRNEIRASAAASIADQAYGLVTSAEIAKLFADMDGKGSESAKQSYLKSFLSDKFGALADAVYNTFWNAYTSYTNAADKAVAAFGTYLNNVNTAAQSFAEYVNLKGSVTEKILNVYNENADADGKIDYSNSDNYAEQRESAIATILVKYDEYLDLMAEIEESVATLNDDFDHVLNLLCEVATYSTTSVNDLVNVAKNISGNYINNMVSALSNADVEMAQQDKTVAYLALRYYMAEGMMVMPSAKGHQTIANQMIKAINGENTNSTAGDLANKVIDLGIDIYHCAKEYLSKPTTGSGQVDTIINPNYYVALGDKITGVDGSYADILADALAMDYTYEGADHDFEFDGDIAANSGADFGTMRTEDLMWLLGNETYADGYTDAKFAPKAEVYREAYQSDLKKAELITINVGVDNLVTYPVTQALLAYNNQETYSMDNWAIYLGSESRYEKVNKGKDALMDLILGIVDTADNRLEDETGYSVYGECETALRTVSTAVEALAYSMIGYIVNLDNAVETIARMNPDATIVLLGYYNPLQDTYIQIDRTVSVGDVSVDLSQEKYKIDTSAITDHVINLANRFLTNYVGFLATDGTAANEGSRIVTVDIKNADLGITNNDEVSKDLSTLTDWTTVSVFGHEITIKIPEYLLETRETGGSALHPDASGHEYIAEQILNALDYEIHADIVIDDAWKYFGDADPDNFTYSMDDESSLYGLDITLERVEGEEIGEYRIYATINNEGYVVKEKTPEYITYVYDGEDCYREVDIIYGTFEIKEKPVYGTITKNRWTMSLDSVVYLNYYMNLEGFADTVDFAEDGGVLIYYGDPDDLIAYDGAAREIMVADNVDGETIVDVRGFCWNEDTEEWFVKTDEIYAKNLGDMAYIRTYVEVADGEYVYGPVAYYSAAWYCYDMLANLGEREDTRYVCAALLEYGASAQVYFDYQADALVTDIPVDPTWATEFSINKWKNIDLSIYDLTFDDAYLDSVVVDDHIRELAPTLAGNREGISYTSGQATLNLVGAIRMSVGYNIDADVIDWDDVASAEVLFWSADDIAELDSLDYSLGNYTYSCELTPATGDEDVNLGDYRAQSYYILAKNLSDSVYFSCRIVMNNGDVYRSGLGYYSPEQFVADHLSDSNNAYIDTVCERIAVYSEMARIRFLENEG